jgi:putative NADPH-quinone reductase
VSARDRKPTPIPPTGLIAPQVQELAKHILIVDGHPDAAPARFVHALAKAYLDGARSAKHEVRAITLAELDFPLLRSNDAFLTGVPPEPIQKCQDDLRWADHVVILFPLWLGSTPAMLKGFLEQLLRPGFAFGAAQRGRLPKKLLKGKSARIVVTMGMPALFYKWYFRSHSLKSLERNVLKFCGFSPIRASIIGMVATMDDRKRAQWLARIRSLGELAR